MDAKPDANGLQSGHASPTSERVESLLAGLIEATLLQVEAINALVESNRELIAAMAEADDAGDDYAPAMYLDGRRA